MNESGQVCCSRIWDRYYGSYPCRRRGKVDRDGKWYCGIHDPVRRKEKQDARDAAWRAKQEVHDKAWRRRVAEAKACSGITTEDLESGVIGRLWGEYLMKIAQE
jgi:hypothetical protein